MPSFLAALRSEITLIVRREIRRALKKGGLPTRLAGGVSARAAKTGGPTAEVPAKTLNTLQKTLGISGPELARLAGVSTATVYNWGKTKKPVRLSAKTNASVTRLLAMTAEQAREELGPAAKRGRKPNQAKRGRKAGSKVKADRKRQEFSAKALNALRRQLKVSGPELARMAGVSTATVYNWEKTRDSVGLNAETAAAVTRLQGLSAEQARAELGPAAKRGRRPGQVARGKKTGKKRGPSRKAKIKSTPVE